MNAIIVRLARNALTVIATALLTCHVAGALADSPEPAASLVAAAQREQTLTWYTAENTDIAEGVVSHFTKRYPGITVKINRSGAEKLGGQFLQENDANIHNADVLTLYDLSIFEDLKAKGLLAKYVPQNASTLDARFKDSGGTYVVTSGDIYVIAYATRSVNSSDVPQDWPDLLAPRWQGRIVLNSPLFSGDAMVGAAGVSSKYGWEFYEKLKAANPLVVQSIPETMFPLVSGERWISLTSVELVQQLARKGDPVAFVVPKGGAVFLPGATGIAASAPHPAAARLFEDFYLSTELQEALGDFGFYPVRSDIKPAKGQLPLAKLPLLIVDPTALGGEKPTIKTNFKRIFGG